jgi:hypothetical protein
MQIPEDVQIDAVLSGKIWNLVHRYCDGAWGSLKDKWTVSFERIVDEARRRGLESFVTSKPAAEGFWLIQAEGGYEVFYLERGVRACRETFSSLEAAFVHWLDQEMSSYQLPARQSPNKAYMDSPRK